MSVSKIVLAGAFAIAAGLAATSAAQAQDDRSGPHNSDGTYGLRPFVAFAGDTIVYAPDDHGRVYGAKDHTNRTTVADDDSANAPAQPYRRGQ